MSPHAHRPPRPRPRAGADQSLLALSRCAGGRSGRRVGEVAGFRARSAAQCGGCPRARRRPQPAGGHGGGRRPQHHQRERGGRRGPDHPRPQRQLPRRGQRWRDPRGGTAPPSRSKHRLRRGSHHRRRGQARGGWPRDLHAPLTQVLGPNQGSKETPVATKIIFAPKMPDPIMDLARAMVPTGYEMIVSEHDDPNFLKHVEGAEYYIGFPRAGMSDAFFKAGAKLKLVQLISAGYDRIDVPAAKQAGVPIANNGGANSVAVAEHTIMLILAVYKKMAFHHINVTHGKWRVGDFATTRTYELAGKTLGIVGLGTIGKKVARRAEAFDMDILYYDVIRLTEDQEDALGVKFSLFPELLASSDVVSLHVPLNDQTRKMMGAREFAMMKKDAIFINTCRGPVVDEEALRHALLSKQIAAAGLDVMVEEPPLI